MEQPWRWRGFALLALPTLPGLRIPESARARKGGAIASLSLSAAQIRATRLCGHKDIAIDLEQTTPVCDVAASAYSSIAA